MDSKNVIAAIALSSAVIISLLFIFIPEQKPIDPKYLKKKIEQNSIHQV